MRKKVQALNANLVFIFIFLGFFPAPSFARRLFPPTVEPEEYWSSYGDLSTDFISPDIAVRGFKIPNPSISGVYMLDHNAFIFVREWHKEFEKRILDSDFKEITYFSVNRYYPFMYEKVYEKYAIEIYPSMAYLPDQLNHYTVKIVSIADYEGEATVLSREFLSAWSWERYKKGLSSLDSRAVATQEYRLWGNPESLRRDVAEAIHALPVSFLPSHIEDILETFETLHKQIANGIEPTTKEKIFYTGPLWLSLGLIWKVVIAPSYIGYYSDGVYYSLVSQDLASFDLGKINKNKF
jgi:hypothetical protein